MLRQSSRPLWPALTVLLTITGALFHFFPTRSFWYDEALTTYVATDTWETLWRWCTQVDIQVPFHYIALKLWAGLVGDSEFALRLLSTLAVILAVAAAIACGRQLMPKGNLGLLLGLLLGGLPGILWVAYEVRAYGWAVMLYLWATAFLLRILYGGDRRRWFMVAYTLLMAGALYTHYTALAGFASHGLLAFTVAVRHLWQTRNWRTAFLLLAPVIGAGILFVPWVPVVLTRGAADRSYYAGSISPEQSLQVMAAFKTLSQQEPTPEMLSWGALYGGLIAVGLALGLLRKDTRRAWWASLILAAVPLAFTVAILLRTPKLTGRYFWPAWPATDILAALAIMAVAGLCGALLGVRGKIIAYGLAVFIAAALPIGAHLSNLVGGPPASDFRAAFKEICEQGAPEDVFILRDGTLFVLDHYYGQRPPCHTPRKAFHVPEALITDVTKQSSFAETQHIIGQIAALRPPNVWVISWQGDVMDPQGLAYGFLDGTTTQNTKFYGDVQVDRYAYDEAGHNALQAVAEQGPLPFSIWYNVKATTDGPNLIALRWFPPANSTLRVGDTVTVLAWWERGTALWPDLRASARITTTDHGWVYNQIDQPPSEWKNYDDRWPVGVPILGRYVLRINDDVPAGKVTVRYVIYDRLGRFEPIIITLGDLTIEK
jgi:Dolichyl-phosphate-mannose-protein mannosyltransferase